MSDADSRFAQVEPLPAEFADKILSARNVTRVRTLYGVIFPLTILGAIGLLVWAGILHRDSIDKEIPSEARFSVFLCVLGICALFAIVATSDVGFLDIQNGFLLFEGDNERYRIPATAIVKCEQDYYTRLVRAPSDKASNMEQVFYFFVVVTVNVAEKMPVELPFRIRRRVRFGMDKKASDANYQLLRDINHLKATVSAVSKI